MNVQVTFKNMDSSDALKSHAQRKIGEKLDRLTYKPTSISVTLSVLRRDHTAHVSFKSGKLNLDASGIAEDMYVAIENVADKLDLQLKKHMNKQHDYSKKASTGDVSTMLASETALASEEE